MIKVSFIIVICLNVVFSSNLHKSEAKAKHGEDCSLFNWCEGDLKCHDYRCLNETELKNATDLPRAPEGDVCDWFHHCKDGFHCDNHRCIVDETEAPSKSKGIDVEGKGNQTVNETEIKPQARKASEDDMKDDLTVNKTKEHSEANGNEDELMERKNETVAEKNRTKGENEDEDTHVQRRTVSKEKIKHKQNLTEIKEEE